jgi:hypothetical protein
MEGGMLILNVVCVLFLYLINKNVKKILKNLRLKKPGTVLIGFKFEGGNGMLNFVLDLPVAGAADVVSRELTVVVDGVSSVETLAGDAAVSADYSGIDNAVVTGSLVDVDDAGNRSEASEFSFVLTDTVAPPAPGAVGLRVTAEV